MTDQKEIPQNITVDTWMDYAKRGKIKDFVEILDGQMGGAKLPFELVDFEKTSPATYVNSLKEYSFNLRNKRRDLKGKETYKEDKLFDLYTFRKLSSGLENAKIASKNEKFLHADAGQLDDTIKETFRDLFEEFDQMYYKDMDNPDLIVSVFAPAMEVVSEISNEYMKRVLNTYARMENTEKILKVFEEGKK